jgi:hypothetical protein
MTRQGWSSWVIWLEHHRAALGHGPGHLADARPRALPFSIAVLSTGVPEQRE